MNNLIHNIIYFMSTVYHIKKKLTTKNLKSAAFATLYMKTFTSFIVFNKKANFINIKNILEIFNSL